MLTESTALRDKVHENTRYFREKIKSVGFDIIESTHPIVAIMFYDAHVAGKAAEMLREKGIYATSFVYPVVPKGKARIRVQISAAHSKEDLDYVIECLKEVKASL